MSEENTIRAGKICGNPVNGLCERVVIEVARVFDGCITRIPSRTFILHLENMTPGLTPPFTYISAASSAPAVFENVNIIPLDERRSRIEGDVVIPLSVRYTDSQGRPGTANSSVTVHREVVLNTPARSLVPFEVTVQASLASDIGTFINNDTVNIVCCIVILTKVIVLTDIVVPSYGRSIYPECNNNNGDGDEDVCTRLLNLPIFPPLD